jgi:hypothetical protein
MAKRILCAWIWISTKLTPLSFKVGPVKAKFEQLGIPRALYRLSVQQRGVRRHLVELIHDVAVGHMDDI